MREALGRTWGCTELASWTAVDPTKEQRKVPYSELSHAAKAPTEFRFLNMAEPVLVGVPSDPEGHGLDMFKRLIDEEGPGGQTPQHGPAERQV